MKSLLRFTGRLCLFPVVLAMTCVVLIINFKRHYKDPHIKEILKECIRVENYNDNNVVLGYYNHLIDWLFHRNYVDNTLHIIRRLTDVYGGYDEIN